MLRSSPGGEGRDDFVEDMDADDANTLPSSFTSHKKKNQKDSTRMIHAAFPAREDRNTCRYTSQTEFGFPA